MRIAINVTLGIVTVYGLWAVFASIFTCIPIRGYWDLTMQPAAKCLPRFPYGYIAPGNCAKDTADKVKILVHQWGT